MTTDWIPGAAIALVGVALSFWRNTGVSEATLSERLDGLKKEFQASQKADEKEETSVRKEVSELRNELRAATAEFRAASMVLARMSSSQEVINQVTTRTVEGIVTRQDSMAHQVSENNATLRLLGELFERIQSNSK